jgi:hypothetical protein
MTSVYLAATQDQIRRREIRRCRFFHCILGAAAASRKA